VALFYDYQFFFALVTQAELRSHWMLVFISILQRLDRSFFSIAVETEWVVKFYKLLF